MESHGKILLIEKIIQDGETSPASDLMMLVLVTGRERTEQEAEERGDAHEERDHASFDSRVAERHREVGPHGPEGRGREQAQTRQCLEQAVAVVALLGRREQQRLRGRRL